MRAASTAATNARIVATLFAVVVLSGRILDRTTGQGLAHVTVTAASGARASTDATGRYRLALEPGRTSVLLESDDVPAQRFAVTIDARATHRDFRACSTTLDYACGAPTVPDSGGTGAGSGREERE